MELLLRPMYTTDIPGVKKVAEETWWSTYRPILKEESIRRFLQVSYCEEALEQALEAHQRAAVSLFWVAVQEGAVIGFVEAMRETDSMFELRRLYVKPEVQRQGVGRRLLEEVIQAGRINSMFAWVEQKNEIGRAFYARRGFVKVDEREEDFLGTVTVVEKWVWRCQKTASIFDTDGPPR
ncbi:GNAT family N-acetyltransferase [Polycladomyces subterraneus]|uniref:GNAT family N-acetyltransferase n=1 Tax=Polycladomyces subterraneus TaxID=1016997 RepID=A0ABT8IRV0_9BACL|nr:GNAT family N-acetyltransferase [Polycladomyces subterraneus]MDN4595453.1 GNAT family N-acetyltransferase [Polycladomyces subterraneus]